jgi:hypothetical protein
MRKQTLAGVCYLLSFLIVVGLRTTARLFGVYIPLVSYVSPFLASFVLTPLLLIPLTKLNRHLLDWRKARGRDIEEEEKYENVDAGIISLRPTPSSDDESRRRPW